MKRVLLILCVSAALFGIASAIPPATDPPSPTINPIDPMTPVAPVMPVSPAPMNPNPPDDDTSPAESDDVIFADLDTNRDGELSQTELDDSTNPKLQGVDFDRDGDGDVSTAEWDRRSDPLANNQEEQEDE